MTNVTSSTEFTKSCPAQNTTTGQIVYKMVLWGGMFPLFGGIMLSVLLPDWQWKSSSVHSAAEILGVFSAASSAILILMLVRRNKLPSAYAFISLSLMTMAILHGALVVHADEAKFIWFHSMSTLISGGLMALVWLPSQLHNRLKYKPLLIGTVIVALALVSLPSLISGLTDALLRHGHLTSLGIFINTIGGIAFLAAALRFVLRGEEHDILNRKVFAAFCFLFGIADIVFEFSNTWDSVWWYWHILQLSAYGILLSFFFMQFDRDQTELDVLNKELEKRVRSRTKDLNIEIHERRQLQEQYRKSEERTRLIVNSAVDGIITIDSRGQVRTFNHGAEKIFGYSVMEVVGRSVSMLMPKDIAARHDQYIQNYLDTGEEKVIGVGREVVGRRKDGKTFLMDLSISEFHDGEETTFVGIVRDITERKETEYRLSQALQELKDTEQRIIQDEKRLRRILETTVSGISVIRKKDMKRVFVNTCLLDMFGAKSLEEFENFGFSNTFAHEDDYMSTVKLIKESNSEKHFVAQRVRLDGTCWWGMQDASTITYEGESSIIVWTYDISDQKQAEDSLAEAEKMASLGGLVAGVAHEVNTPIGVGVTAASHLKQRTERFVKLIEQGELRRSDLDTFVEMAISSTNILEANLSRASNLISSFKQVAVDQSSEKKRSINVLDYVRDVLASLHPYLKNTKHTVLVDGDETIAIDTFPGAVSQLLTNLIMNSLSHAFDQDETGTICIHVEAAGADLVMTYSDDGQGMNDDVRSHIFDPFFTTKRGSGGSGLGMHIVFNQVTQTLGGTVKCESEIGQGTTFTVTIPQKAGEEQ